jgi:phage terminase large subunit-like protein
MILKDILTFRVVEHGRAKCYVDLCILTFRAVERGRAKCYVNLCILTFRAVERGRAKCGQYWPPDEDGEEQFEDYLVINTRMEVYQDYNITWLFLLNTKVNN